LRFDLTLNLRQRHRRIDDLDALRMLRRQRQVRGPHTFEERPLLALEMIRLSIADSARADVERSIEQQRQVGLESLLNFGLQRVEQATAGTATSALVSDGGVGETV